jgi:MerR family transcriptional regulator, light-induced transcriptional regulator
LYDADPVTNGEAETTSTAPDFEGVPIAEASRQLGIPMPTLRSWERRYAMPATVRGLGKHRRYTEQELQGLRLMRDEIARGKRAGLAAQSVRELMGLTGDAADFITAILSAAERHDPMSVRDQLAKAHATLGLAACLDEVLLPAMQQVGLWWETGRCDIDTEHLSTEAARGWLESLNDFAPPPSRPTTIVLACGPTDLHTVGLEALAVLLRYRQWPCRMLGARTSVPALTAAVAASGAGAVVVVSHLNNGRKRAIQAVHAANNLGVEVFYAGNAFNSARSRRNLPGTYLGSRLDGACELITRQLAAD